MTNVLNDDVLDHILSLCITSTLASFALASSRSHALTLPHLLRYVSLSKSPFQLESFFKYILGNTRIQSPSVNEDGSRSLAYTFTSLKLVDTALAEVDAPFTLWAPLLPRALELMPNIRSFVMGDCVEEIVVHSPGFAFALLTRPFLTRLELSCIGDISSNSLGKAMHLEKRVSMIERVKFAAQDEDVELMTDEGIGSVLFHSRENLTHINVESYELDAFLGGRAPESGPLIFPNVVSLSLSWSEVSFRRVAKSFPALRTLTFRTRWYPDTMSTPFHTIPFPHLMSVTGFQKHLVPFFQSISSPSLRHVSMDASWRTSEDQSISPFLFLREVPSLESLSFTHWSGMRSTWWEELDVVLPHLKYLSLILRGLVKADLEILLSDVPAGLASVPLAYISILFSGDTRSDPSPGAHSRFSKKAIAYSYAKNIRTLKYIDVCKISHGKPRSSTWWSVGRKVGADEFVWVEEIEPIKGMKLRDQYNLEI
ncbi:hypothetical protein CPB84DRAFT_1790026 [Gymnopilus junonius]|uniref:F-box domain-containing protein n=1 Tax=Gymnopilus junonius TaxID=109634 RepID=A0A9P5TJF0_GYMJU|nr:hypothetical protein CPB84DRAFT_1790026 [Gymnopilus junonius]